MCDSCSYATCVKELYRTTALCGAFACQKAGLRDAAVFRVKRRTLWGRKAVKHLFFNKYVTSEFALLFMVYYSFRLDLSNCSLSQVKDLFVASAAVVM